MSVRVSRADVLWYLHQQGADELGEILDCFGFKHPLVERRSQVETITATTDTITVVPAYQAASRDTPLTHLPSEVFYRVSDSQPSQLLPQTDEVGKTVALEWVQSINQEALNIGGDLPTRLQEQAPPHIPLVPWVRLWPVLRQMLSTSQTRKRPDIPKLVRLVAQGGQLQCIPQQQRQYWAASAILLVDGAKRLNLLDKDYLELEQQLKRLRGETGLVSLMVMDYPGGRVLDEAGEHPWKMPAPETPLLIISDLGVYAENRRVTEQWLQFGRQLRAAGCKAYVLIPVPVGMLSQEITTCFHCISWDRWSPLDITPPTGATWQTVEQRQQQAAANTEYLLALLSVAVEMDAGLIRAMRYRLDHQERLTIANEMQVWNHKRLEQASQHIQLPVAAIETYRNKLANLATQQPELMLALFRLTREQMAHEFVLDYFDALCVAGDLAGVEDDVLLQAADRYLKQFVLAVDQHKTDGGLAYNGYYFLERQAYRHKADRAYLSSLWAMLKVRLQHAEPRPEWLQLAAANPFLSAIGNTQVYQLVQYGERFYLGTPQQLAALRVAGFGGGFYVLASIETSQRQVVEERNGQQFDYSLPDNEPLSFPVNGVSRKLHVGGQCFELMALTRPAWAGNLSCSANGWEKPAIQPTGEDEYGVYFDLVLPQPFPERSRREHLTQRFRYIPPQTFLMGSPEDEPGRYDRETQYNVTLTQGYWLADTTVTQAFWEAVMGANPSHFKGTQRPVETVSWDDTQTFIQKLQQHWQLLDVRLPLEAEWECACRAGTTSAFSFGGKNDLNTKQVNYSGKWDEGDKEGKGETKPVKSYPPNAWGLYEMHGNVWEWCQDEWQDDLGSESVTLSPSTSGRGVGVRESPPEGVQRQSVVRGGSWYDEGGDCRSAYRGWSSPGFRLDDLGFRLALGHASSGAAEPPTRQEQSGGTPDKPRRGAADKQVGSQTAVGRAGKRKKKAINTQEGK